MTLLPDPVLPVTAVQNIVLVTEFLTDYAADDHPHNELPAY